MLRDHQQTGKTTVGVEIIKNIYHNFKKERTLVITHSNQTLDRIFEGLSKYPNLKNHQVLRLGSGEEKISGKNRQQFTAMGRVESINGFRQSLFEKVHRLVICLNLEGKGDFTDSCDSCLAFYQNHVLPAWNNRSPGTFPFENFFYEDVTESGKPSPFSNETAIHDAFAIIQELFKDIKELRPYEIISNARQKANLLLAHDAKIVAMTSTYAAMHRKELVELGFVCDNVVIEEAAQMTELDTFCHSLWRWVKAVMLAMPYAALCLLATSSKMLPLCKTCRSGCTHNLIKAYFSVSLDWESLYTRLKPSSASVPRLLPSTPGGIPILTLLLIVLS